MQDTCDICAFHFKTNLSSAHLIETVHQSVHIREIGFITEIRILNETTECLECERWRLKRSKFI